MNAALQRVISPDLKIRDIAKQCVESSPDWVSAAEQMRKILDAQPDMYRSLMEPLIDHAIWQAIALAARETRKEFTAKTGKSDDGGDARAMGKARRQDWLDYQLSSGMRLGDADRAKLTEEIAMHEANVKGNLRQANFYTAIAKRIDGKKVREVLSDTQIAKIWEKITC
jgi:hypothetical protein